MESKKRRGRPPKVAQAEPEPQKPELQPEPRPKHTPKVEAFDFTDPDIFLVENKDPELYYRWVRKEDLNIQKFKRWGFKIEGKQDGVEAPTGISDSADSSIPAPPGHILMSCPKDRNDKRVDRNRQKFEDIRQREIDNLELQSRMLKRMGSRIGLKFEEKTGYDK